LSGQDLEVLTVDKKHVVVRSPDGLSLKLPRPWTNMDGADCSEVRSGDVIFTAESLRELAVLLEALTRREGSTRSERSAISERPVR